MMIALLILIPLVALAGVFYIVRGARYRVGGAPYCFNCNNDLTGGPTVQCPFCGVPIPLHKMRFGKLTPRRDWIRRGKVLLVVAGLLCLPATGGVYRKLRHEWYFLRPTSLVLWNLEGGSLSQKAAKEIGTRCRLGALSPKHARQAVDILFPPWDAASTDPGSQQHINCRADLFEAGCLRAEQTAVFFAAIDQVTYHYFPISGEKSIIELHGRVYPPTDWAPRRTIEILRIDDEQTGTIVFDAYDFPLPAGGEPPPRVIGLEVAPRNSLRIRVTTAWNDFRTEPFYRSYIAAAGDEQQEGFILRQLLRRNPIRRHAYHQELLFGQFHNGQSTLLDQTPRQPTESPLPTAGQ